MALESTTTIAGLDAVAPLGSDPRSQGDDHLRLIKAVLKNIFPGVGGSGFAVPITAKETELNFLVGTTSNVQTQLNSIKTNGAFVSGTRMIFYQAAAPSGWTIVALGANSALIIGSGGTQAGGGGASHNIVTGCTVVASHTHTINPASVTTSSDTHFHTYLKSVSSTIQTDGAPNFSYPSMSGFVTTNTSSDAHTHTVDIPSTVSSTNTSLAVWQPLYTTVIVCNKT